MSTQSKKITFISTLAVIPLGIIVFRNFITTRKGWSIPEVQFQTIFWCVRALLAPLIVLYVIRYWTDVNRIYRLVFTQVIGVTTYLFLHWSMSFFLCKLLLKDFDQRNWNLFNIVKDESILLNFFSYIIPVFVFYLWIYVERFGKATSQAILLEQELADSKFERFGQTENLNPAPAKETLDKLTIKTGTKITIVPVNTIAYLQADGPYVKIVTEEKSHLLNTPLYELYKLLPESFLRVHRSRIVNIEFIRQVRSLQNGDYVLELKNDVEIRASRTYREGLRAALGHL